MTDTAAFEPALSGEAVTRAALPGRPSSFVASTQPRVASSNERAPIARMVLFVGMQPQPVLREALAGDSVRCVWSIDTASALATARAALFDGAVIDAATIGSSIGSALSELRAALRCPMIVMAQRRDEIDEIVALECGARVYLVHPVSPRRLHAYLQSQMRQAGPAARAAAAPPRPEGSWEPAGPSWRLDIVRQRLWVDELCAGLTGAQCALLQCLLDARGAVVSRARLAASLPTRRPLSGRTVDVYLFRLRKRLAEVGVDPRSIQAVPAHGYLLNTSLRRETRAPTRVALDASATARD
jgi:DNA-binding response OmpR family regulator